MNGQASIVDARYNGYRIEYSYSSCAGSFAVLDGRDFRGLATLDNTVNPERLIVGAVSDGTPKLAVVFVFARI